MSCVNGTPNPMTDQPTSLASTGSSEAKVALFDACRALVVERGFGALSLRAVARASGWTMGEIAYRIGSKDQLLADFLDEELSLAKMRDAAWRDRLAGVPAFDGPVLAATIDAVLGDAPSSGRGAPILWHEAMVEAAAGAIPADRVAAWIDDRRAHWIALLRGRHARAEALGKVVADYVVGEQLYSVVLASNPDYRMRRSACIARLCRVGDDKGWAGWEGFISSSPRPTVSARVVSLGRHAEGVAEAAAQIILERGPSAVTHRSVAAVLGQSPSAVAHHFGTRVDIISAGFDALFGRVQSMLDAFEDDASPGAMLGPQAGTSFPAAVAFVRTMHIIALVAARDAAVVPLMFDERASRGRLIEAWYGEKLIGAHRSDHLLLQVISLVTSVRTLVSVLHGEVVPGGDREALTELLLVMT
jgi:AcrR family transcriptional regulator